MILACACCLLACSRPAHHGRPTARKELNKDIVLLDVALAFKVGTSENRLADDAPKQVLMGETVWVYPVVRLQVPDTGSLKDTVYLANTLHLGRIGRNGDTLAPSWLLPANRKLWSKYKNDVSIEWFLVEPTRRYFRKAEKARYHLKTLDTCSWCLELTGPTGTRRLVALARYGTQAAFSGNIASEDAVSRLPWVSFLPDTTNLGWSSAMLGLIPYRDACTQAEALRLTGCDDKGLLAYGLCHTGYRLGEDAKLDSAGQLVFQGYIKLGRLYDTLGRPAHLALGRDVKQGDAIHFLSLRRYGLVVDVRPRTGLNYGGLPYRLPVLSAYRDFPRIQPLYQVLFSWRTLFTRSAIKVLRYPPVIPKAVIRRPRR